MTDDQEQGLINLRFRIRNGEAVPDDEIRAAIDLMRESRFAASRRTAARTVAKAPKHSLTAEELEELI